MQVGYDATLVLFFDCPEDVLEKRLLSRNEVSVFVYTVSVRACVCVCVCVCARVLVCASFACCQSHH